MKKLFTLTFLLAFSFITKADFLSTINASFGNGVLDVSIQIDESESEAIITIAGPSDNFFAVGLGNDVMAGTYVIVCNQQGNLVQERKLGARDAGTLLTQSVTVESNTIDKGILTLVLKRPLTGLTTDHYDLSGIGDASSVKAIYAVGSSQILAWHGSGNKGRSSITFSSLVSGTEEQTFENKQSISMYPNPATDKLNFTFQRASGNTEVKIMTLQGQMVLEKSLEASTSASVSIEDIQAGTYMVIFKNNEHDGVFTLIKE